VSRSFNGTSSTFAEYAGAIVNAFPVTMSCWFYPADNTTTQCLLGEMVAASTQNYVIVAAGAVAGDPVQLWYNGSSRVASTNAYSVNVWNHVCAIAASSTDRRMFLNNVKATAVTTFTWPTTMTVTDIGRKGNLTAANFFNGLVAEAAIWNVALSDGEVAALAAGVRPVDIQPTALKAYWPLWGFASPEPDFTINNRSMTITGATQGNHAPVHLFSRRKVSGLGVPLVDGGGPPPSIQRFPAAILGHL
jgi:hypothetical protein